MKHLGILGCGWLGTLLATKLNSFKWNLKVSKTTAEGLEALRQLGFDSYSITLSENSLEGNLEFFENLDQIVVSIPPKRNDAMGFSQKIDYLINFLKSKKNCKIIFLSSISVYGKKEGFFDETSTLSPETESSRQLVESEKMILKSSNPSLILRLGGLVGYNRNPIFHLHKKIIPNPNGIINFIHQKDAVEAIFKLLCKPKLEGIFNLVSPNHPKREDYYLQMAKIYNLSTPKFTKQNPVIKRQIKATKIQKLTDFNYQFDNLLN